MIVFSIKLGAVLAVAHGGAPQAPLSLDEALKIAEQNAYSLKIAQTGIRKADANVREADSNRNVQVQLNASYTRFDKAISGSQGTIRPIDSKSANLQLSYPLDFGGALGRVVRSAKYLYFASQNSFQAELNVLKLNVRQAYFQSVQASDQVAVFKEALGVAQERLKNLRAQLNQGQIARVDVLRGETQVSQAQSDLLRSENALTLAKNALNNAMSRPIDTPFETAPVEHPEFPDIDEAELARIAVENRYELRSIRNQSASFAELVRAAAAARIPTVTFAVQNSYSFGELGFGSTTSSLTGSLSISVNVWDSGRSKAQVDRYREDLKAAALQYDQAALGVSLEVRQAVANFRNARSRLEVARLQVLSAEENYRLSVLRTDNGEGINLEVVDAQNQLTSAKSQRVAANYEMLAAFAQLQKAVGSDELKRILMEEKK